MRDQLLAPAEAGEDHLLVTAEVAQMVRKPVGTLRQWRHRGIGPRGFRVGNTVVYRASEVTRWISAQEALDTGHAQQAVAT